MSGAGIPPLLYLGLAFLGGMAGAFAGYCLARWWIHR